MKRLKIVRNRMSIFRIIQINHQNNIVNTYLTFFCNLDIREFIDKKAFFIYCLEIKSIQKIQ